MTFRKVSQDLSIPEPTLRQWVDKYVCGFDKLPTKKIRGRSVIVFQPKHIERLKMFQLYRQWFLAINREQEVEIEEIAGLIDEIEKGEYEGVIDILRRVKEALVETSSNVHEEIERLEKLHSEVLGK